VYSSDSYPACLSRVATVERETYRDNTKNLSRTFHPAGTVSGMSINKGVQVLFAPSILIISQLSFPDTSGHVCES